MLTTNAHPPTESAPRFLKPGAGLARLRPLTVEWVSRRLQGSARLSTALQRLEQCFPGVAAQYADLKEVAWYEILAQLANLIEAENWFEINWPLLNEAWAAWLADDSENGDHLATFLDYVPVVLYGFDHRGELFDYPPLELLHALLAECELAVISPAMLIYSDLYEAIDSWSHNDRQAAWSRLGRIEADPGRYPEPVRALPQLARWVCHRSGNLILDTAFDAYDPLCFSWIPWDDQAQVTALRTAWPMAQRLIPKLNEIMEWYQDDPSTLVALADFLTEDTDDDALQFTF